MQIKPPHAQPSPCKAAGRERGPQPGAGEGVEVLVLRELGLHPLRAQPLHPQGPPSQGKARVHTNVPAALLVTAPHRGQPGLLRALSGWMDKTRLWFRHVADAHQTYRHKHPGEPPDHPTESQNQTQRKAASFLLRSYESTRNADHTHRKLASGCPGAGRRPPKAPRTPVGVMDASTLLMTALVSQVSPYAQTSQAVRFKRVVYIKQNFLKNSTHPNPRCLRSAARPSGGK